MNKEISKEDCVIFKTADFIGKKWTLRIILELSKGREWKRYSEIKKKLDSITPKMLSARLKELETQGLVEKRVTTTSVPIRSEYKLTKSGIEFLDILECIKQWSIKNKDPNSECKNKDCKYCEN
jgi:DNA-binding HxlR family transcriptional regulator